MVNRLYLLRNFLLFALNLIVLSALKLHGQTTFTENAAAHGLNISGLKDGGHAWSDFDGDGDLDVLVLENQNGGVKSYLMRNNAGSFTNVQSTLAPGMLTDRAERQAAWGDLNGDGRPDFMVGSHGNSGGSPAPAAFQIFLQNADGTFGNGIGGTAPITVGRTGHTININPINAEGAGFFDFEGDGDLDIFFDSHNRGIELIRNNYIDHDTHAVTNPAPNAHFTHITPGNGPGVVEYGLNQFATDGDFGSAADINDDGWVDIFMRKRDENDFFLNQGGIFTNGADLAQAANANKGGNALWDLDNDGDLDAVWTENGFTQIFRNDGPGIWTALGAAVFPGLPQPGNPNDGASSNRIDGLAGGDIDNDGDIDIFLSGTSRSYLYINQLNSPTPAPGTVGSGSAMTFSLDSETFVNANGEGVTMVDFDDDGDLDIYMSISGTNRLFVNQLPEANRNNHLIIDVKEDRGADGSTGATPERVATGANILIKDCNGNIISGLRQVNGVYGHGTQSPESVHFGLPLGEDETYIIEVRYPNYYDPTDGFNRLVGTIIASPITISGTNHYSINSTQAEISKNSNVPVANDDQRIVTTGTNISVQLNLLENDYDADGDSFFISNITQPAVGSVVIDDANAGLVTYTYNAATNFQGTTFNYTISDARLATCSASGKTDAATVRILEPCTDPMGIDTDGDGINDMCDLDDDNDGILDCDEAIEDLGYAYFGWNMNFPAGTRSMDNSSGSEILDWVLDSADDLTDSGISVSSPGSSIHITNMESSNLGEAIENNDYFQVTFTTGNDVANLELTRARWAFWDVANMRDSYYMSSAISDDGFATSTLLATNVFITAKPSGVFDMMDAPSYKLTPNTQYEVRLYVYGQIDDTTYDYSVFDDFRLVIDACRATDSDLDGNQDQLDIDSDNDGCTDADEAYIDTLSDADPDNDGFYGSGIPTVDINGMVSGAAYTTPNVLFKNINGNSCIDTDNDGVADVIDLDDDNDGILDIVEHPKTVLWVHNGTLTSDQQNTIDKLIELGFTVTIADDNDAQDANNYSVTYVHPTVDSGAAFTNVANLESTKNGVITSENALFDELMGTTGPTGNPPTNTINITNNTHPITSVFPLGNLNIGDGSYYVQNIVSGTHLGQHPDGTTNLVAWDVGEALDNGIAPGRRVAAPHTSYNEGLNSVGEDLLVSAILWTWALDTDNDGIYDHLDSDSDDDGCNDADEAYGDIDADADDNGMYGNGNPPVNADGTVSAASYSTPLDVDSNLVYDFQEQGSTISIMSQPSDLTICAGCSGSFSVSSNNADTYQWQLFNGVSWDTISNGGIYSGVSTSTLTITNSPSSESGNRYRVLMNVNGFICGETSSNSALLTVNVNSVITNRRITYRVNKN